MHRDAPRLPVRSDFSVQEPDRQPPEHPAERTAREERLRALVESLRPDLLRWISTAARDERERRMGSADLASASIERFLSVAHARGVDRMSRGEAWGLLSTIAQHLAIDGIRRERARSLALARLRTELEIESPELEPAVVIELRELVERALGAMTPDERAVVSRRLGGASWAEISAETGVGEEALRQRWTALRRRLRELVDEP